MRIALILPYQNDGLEPLGLLYLAAVLKQAGHDVRSMPPNKQAVVHALEDFSPDILAYSVVTGWHRQYIDLNQWIRSRCKRETLSVFGGPHPTFFTEFINQPCVDAICLGEGEVAFPDFVHRMENQEDFTTTKNWWVKHNGAICKNPLRPEIDILDDIPFPDRSFLEPHSAYINRNLRVFVASRGCPYNCSYCFNHSYRQLYKENGLAARVRYRGVDNLIQEIRKVREEYGMRSVAFFDDIFVTVPDWLDEFATKYQAQIGLPFECNLRVEQVTPRALSDLRRAGCAIIALGVETADEEERFAILRRRYTNEQLTRACSLIREAGILLKTYNILGLPPGNLRGDWDTLRMNIALRVDLPTASLFQPYPGTDLGEQCRIAGLWDGNVDSITLGFYNASSLRLTTHAQIEILQKFFFLGVKIPLLLPLIGFIVGLADLRLLRKMIFLAHRAVQNLSLTIGRKIAFAEDFRRIALTRLARR